MWTDDEISFLIANYSTNTTVFCAQKLQKSRSSVQKKALSLGLEKGRDKRRWSKQDEAFLVENYAIHGAGYCSEKLSKTMEAVTNKAQRLSLRRNGDKRYNRQEAPRGYIFCGICDQILPEGMFYKKTKNGKYGQKASYCRSCCQEKARHFFGKYNSNLQARRLKNPIHFIYVRLKASAKKRNILFTLTEEDLRSKFVSRCPIYDKELIFFSNSDWSPSVDRIDSNKGYTKDNIIIVSSKANRQKNTCTVEEMKKLYEFYSSLTK